MLEATSQKVAAIRPPTSHLYVTYSYADACRNIFNTIKMSGHSSLEKYVPLTLFESWLRKGYCVRGELETEQNCNILTPKLFWLKHHFFPVLLGCSTEGLGAQPLLRHGSHSSIFSPTDLNFLSPGLYNNLTFTYFLRASHLHSLQPVDSQGYPLISSTGCTFYLYRCISSFEGSAGSQYATYKSKSD